MQSFRLDDWLVEPQLNRLTRNGETKLLEPKAMDVLACLLARPGEVVSSDEILTAVWPDRIVEESSVHQRVSRLRKALGDDPREPRYIESIPRRGYRIIAPVTRCSATRMRGLAGRFVRPAIGAMALAVVAAASATFYLQRADETEDRRLPRLTETWPERLTVAVMPLAALGADPRLELAAEGIAQELRHQIAAYDHLYDVLPGTVVEDLTQAEVIERSHLVIDGSVQSNRRRVIAKLELVETASGLHLWTQTFEGARDTDEFELYRGIASQSARYFLFGIGALRYWGPAEPEAYGAFFKYLHHQGGGSPDADLYWLQRTLELDPEWVDGWNNLTWAFVRNGILRRNPALLDRARKALAHARANWDTREVSSMAGMLMLLDGELSAAEQVLSGDYRAYAILMAHSGLHQEAETYLRYYVEELEPHDVGAWDYLAMVRAAQGDVRGAIDAARVNEGLFPPGSLNGLWGLVWGLPRSDLDEARRLHARVRTRLSELRAGTATERHHARFERWLAFEIAVAEGDLETARECADWFVGNEYHLRAGTALLRLGDHRAEAEFDMAAHDAFANRYYWPYVEPFIPPELRGHSSVLRLKQALGYTDAWRLELCRRAASMSGDSHIDCDPSHYELNAAARDRTVAGANSQTSDVGDSRSAFAATSVIAEVLERFPSESKLCSKR